jgi:hypothetical protein
MDLAISQNIYNKFSTKKGIENIGGLKCKIIFENRILDLFLYRKRSGK